MNQSQNVLKMSNTSRETATPLIDGFAVHGPVQLYDISAIPGRLCCTVAYWVVNNRHCVLIMPVFANCAQEEVSHLSIYNNPCLGNRERQSQLHHDQNAVEMMTIARLSQAQRKRLISQNTSLQ